MTVVSILAVIISLITTALAILIGRKIFMKPVDPVFQRTETQENFKRTEEGTFYSLLTESELFENPLRTTEDIDIDNGSVLYYLIEGEVEILFNNFPIMKTYKDYFVYSVLWCFSPLVRGSVAYRIKKNSLLYKIDRESHTVRYLLMNRLFKGTVYTLVNYLEEETERLDIKNIQRKSKDMTEKEKIENIKKEICLIKPIEKIEEITIEGEYTVPANCLIYIVKGKGTVEYREKHTHHISQGDLIGCLERITTLKKDRIIKASERIEGVKIKLSATREITITELEKVGEEVINTLENKIQLEITDAMITWRIFQPGEKLSAEVPTKSIKIITNGYFLKDGDVKYFGISSNTTLFEKEVLLGHPSPFQLTSTRVSEVIEIPKEYIEVVTTHFQRSSLELYKRILQRTDAEQELQQPSVITFVPNDPKETQLEIFTHFLRTEMIRHDTCKILSSGEIDHMPSRNILPLLNYIGDLQKEYAYILIPITDISVTTEKTISGNKENRSPPKEMERTVDISGLSGVFLSEIIFYVITNGDRRSLNISSNIFCKIDTLVLHRDNRMRVSPGRYYGQKHNVEFPVIDVPLSAIKTRDLGIYAKKTHCRFTEQTNQWIPYFPLNDMHRFIRTLKGTNVGLVLGGGGARGIAHIGIIEALEEARIPIDAVGGTSMGAFVGALYAEDTDNKKVFIRAKRLTSLIGSIWRVLLDLTYPICSMFTGKGFNWALRIIFKNKRIEDLWLPYYCITTDISRFEEKQHKQGILWRYVRASMSLSGYLPPLCDNGSFLLDGGYMNNVPADAMRSMGVRNIIAVDVGSEVETTFADYGDSINGFYILIQKIFSTKKFLSLTEIQYRLAYLTSMHKERSLKSDVTIKYIRPDLAGYKTMNFRQFDEIVAHGYQYGKKIIAEWKKTGEYLELTTLTRAPVQKKRV